MWEWQKQPKPEKVRLKMEGPRPNTSSSLLGNTNAYRNGAVRAPKGMSKHPLYGNYNIIMTRALAKGIEVSPRWMEEGKGFLNFLEDMGPRPEVVRNGRSRYTVIRKDKSFGFTPSNCEWGVKGENL